MQRDVFGAAGFGQLRGVNRIDGVIIKARANLYRHRNGDGFLNLSQNLFQPLVVLQ